MGRFTAAKTTLIWFVVLTNRWECGDLRSHIGCSSGLVCNENGDKRRASKYLRRVLERFFGASISLPTKTSWCQATVVALLWSACKSLATTHPASWDAPSRGCDRVDDLLGHQVIAQ